MLGICVMLRCCWQMIYVLHHLKKYVMSVTLPAYKWFPPYLTIFVYNIVLGLLILFALQKLWCSRCDRLCWKSSSL